MSIDLMVRMMESDLPPVQRFIMLILANYANDEGENIWPAVSTIVRLTGYGETTVHENIRYLIDVNLLQSAGKGPKGPQRYRINLTGIDEYRQGEVQPAQDAAPAPVQGGVSFLSGFYCVSDQNKLSGWCQRKPPSAV